MTNFSTSLNILESKAIVEKRVFGGDETGVLDKGDLLEEIIRPFFDFNNQIPQPSVQIDYQEIHIFPDNQQSKSADLRTDKDHG